MNFLKLKISMIIAASLLTSACGSGKPTNSSSTVSSTSSSSITSVSSSSLSSSSSSIAKQENYVVLYAVNAGGKAYTAQDGTEFTGDYYFSGGNLGSTSDYIQGTPDQELFNQERWGEFAYNFPLKPGSYSVTLYLAETWFGPQQSGNRVFDVKIEGATKLTGFNPLAVAGHDVAHIVEFNNIAVNDGNLTLNFLPTLDQASLRGIVVRGLEGNKVEQEPISTGTTGNGPVPTDCPQTATAGANDFVLFDGSKNIGPLTGNTIELHQGWVLNEVWAIPDGAKIQIVDTAGGAAIQYSNAGIYTGFKLTPPMVFGERRSFSMSGVDLYIQGSSGSPQFGLRVIKPGENEGNGGASTTTWVRNSQGQQDLTLSANCSLLSLSMPSNWNVASQKANRFIVEVKNGWNNSSQLRIRRVVVKGFKYAD